LDNHLLSNYFNRYSIDIEQLDESEKLVLLTNTEILSDDLHCTVAGLLCFGTNPLKFLPQAEIKFAHFTEERVTDQLIDRQNIQRNIADCIDQTLAVIKNNIREESQISGARRENTKVAYSDKVFRELITNALIHRDWSKLAPIRVLMYSDRIEFISPGRLPNSVSLEKLKYGVSHPRNPIILKFLENMGYVERLGRGLPMVYQETQKLKKFLNFEEVGEEFRVVIEL
jgi:ATP-dependent DNA helicase RecG